jgi:hypothetical protein
MDAAQEDKMTRWMLLILAAVMLAPAPAVAASKGRMLYHATSRAVAKKLGRSGRLSMHHARKTARFGKAAYFSTSKTGARREVGKRAVMLKSRVRSGARSKIIDTRKMSTAQLKRYSGRTSMRGTMKRGVIGPKLGRAIGKRAGREGKALRVRPKAGKGKWSNVVVPARVYRRRLITTRVKGG